MLSEEQAREHIAIARRVRKIRSFRSTTAGMPGFMVEARYPEIVAAIEAIIDDRAALAAELVRLRAAVAALAGEFSTWTANAESLGGCWLRSADAYRACAARAAGIAAAEPRPAGDATAADDAKGG